MARFITISKDLILFRVDKCELTEYRVFPEGAYALESVANPFNKHGETWWKIVGQPWGNARPCWNVVTAEVPQLPAFRLRLQIMAGMLALGCAFLSFGTLTPSSALESASLN